MKLPALTLGFLLACVTPLEPENGMSAMLPPAKWSGVAEWVWQECAREVRDRPLYAFADLKFYAVPGESFVANGDAVIGFWRENRIYLAASRVDEPGLLVLRHELLHAFTGLRHGEDWYRTHNPFRACWMKADGEFVHGAT